LVGKGAEFSLGTCLPLVKGEGPEFERTSAGRKLDRTSTTNRRVAAARLMRGLAAWGSRAQATGSNIHSGTLNRRPSGNPIRDKRCPTWRNVDSTVTSTPNNG
jgi:hypothetical protein